MKKIKLTGIIVILCLFMPQTAQASIDSCRYPYGSSDRTNFECTSCESIGYKSNGLYNSFTLACIDPQCVSAQTGKTKCDKCSSSAYVDGYLCKTCPQGATCDGFTLVCSAGQYSSGSSCASCHASCTTCSGGGSGSCLSCKEGYYSSSIYSDGTRYCYSCDSSCRLCSGSGKNNCTACESGKYLAGGTCLACPADGTCDGGPAVTCRSGYVFSNGACTKEQAVPTATVSSCPSRMTISSDGCCCINK